MAQYQAGSLADIAEMFERLAATAREMADRAPTKREEQFERGRASAWADAAAMLRKTELLKAGGAS